MLRFNREKRIKEQAASWMNEGDFYHLVDLGCGKEAWRVIDLARRHPDKHFLGIDPKISRTALKAAKRMKNLHLIREPVEEVLPHIPNDSILAANADYLFNNLKDVDIAEDIMGLLKAKLRRSGRLYVSHQKRSPMVRDYIAGHGFKVSASRSVEEMRLPMTPRGKADTWAQKTIEALQRGEDVEPPVAIKDTGEEEVFTDNPKQFMPMRFSARLPRKK